MVKMLVNFRTHQIAVTANVQKAFLQIRIKEEDRDAIRFLWFKETPEIGRKMPTVQEFRMTSVPFGSTASPFLLTATLKHHFGKMRKCYPETVPKLEKSFYVDDLVTGGPSVAEVERF